MRYSSTRWLILILLLITATYAIAEDVTLTTYYPSPRGVYAQLRIGVGTPAVTTADLYVLKPIDDGNFAFRVDDAPNPDTTPFVITQTGNVGVQTTAPVSALDVNGTITGTGLTCINCVNSTTIANGSILNVDIAPGTVTGGLGGNLAVGTVTGGPSSNLTLNTIDSGNIFDGTIQGIDVLDGSLTGTDSQDAIIGSPDVDPTQVQQRVSGICAAGQSIQSVNQDGTVVYVTTGLPSSYFTTSIGNQADGWLDVINQGVTLTSPSRIYVSGHVSGNTNEDGQVSITNTWGWRTINSTFMPLADFGEWYTRFPLML